MKTKTLLIAAAALAATVISSQAQVYSGVVGYATLNLTNGYNLVCNPLDYDGTGTNNTIQTAIGTNLPPNTKVYAYNTTLGSYQNITLNASQVWSAGSAGALVKTAIQPGGGVFVFIPGSTPTNVTLVGQVLQGTNKTTYATGYQITSVPFPQAGNLTASFGYVANPSVGASHDQVLTWNQNLQSFITHKWGTTSWSAGDPSLNVGDAFFLVPIAPNTWTNSLIVQ